MLNRSCKISYILLLCVAFLNPFFPQLLLAKQPQIIQTNPSKANEQQTKIKVDLSRRRVFLYQGKTQVKSYPVAVGKTKWETPTGSFKILDVMEKPIWINPFTDKEIPGGHPDNPLGNYWIGFWTDGRNWVGFHGTPKPESVGKAASHGCLRMHNKDIEDLFKRVRVGTPVIVTK